MSKLRNFFKIKNKPDQNENIKILNENVNVNVQNEKELNREPEIQVVLDDGYRRVLMVRNMSVLEKEIVNWNKNRPPDEVRIAQICDYYKQTGVTLIPGMIYAWEHDNIYEIYDGIHRLLAGLMTGNPMTFFITIITTDREQDIIEDFKNINKSISVPSIYLEETSTAKKIVCESVVDEMCRRYPQFVSASRKPYQHNFNRDNLIEFVSTFDIDFSISGIDKKIINQFNLLNLQARDHTIEHGINIPKKCDYHKFYLFFLDKSYIREQVEKFLK